MTAEPGKERVSSTASSLLPSLLRVMPKLLLGQVDADILPLIVVNVDGGFRLGCAFGSLDVGLNDVVLFADRHALGEFAHAIRYLLPAKLLFRSTPNTNGNSGH